MTQAPATPELVERLRSPVAEQGDPKAVYRTRPVALFEEAADALEAQQARLAELEAENEALTKALTGLTCGGSEFFIRKGDRYVADIDACVSWVRRTKEDAHRRTVKAITEQKASQAALRSLFAEGFLEAGVRLTDECGRQLQWAAELEARLPPVRQALSSQGRHEGGETDPDFKVWSERRAVGVEWLGYTQPQVMEWLADQSRRYSGPDNRFGRALSALIPSPDNTNPEAEHG